MVRVHAMHALYGRLVVVNQAVDETQERLEMLGVELDDMCRRLGMGDSFQVGDHDICWVPFCQTLDHQCKCCLFVGLLEKICSCRFRNSLGRSVDDGDEVCMVLRP